MWGKLYFNKVDTKKKKIQTIDEATAKAKYKDRESQCTASTELNQKGPSHRMKESSILRA